LFFEKEDYATLRFAPNYFFMFFKELVKTFFAVYKDTA